MSTSAWTISRCPNDALAVAKRQGRLHRNFQGYSTQPDCDLIGLGVSAIGRVGATYSQNAKTLEEYCDHLDQGRLPVVRGLALSRDDLARRAVIMALMCQGQVVFESIELAWLLDFREYFAPELEAAARPGATRAWCVLDDAGIQVTQHGLVLRARGRHGVRPLPAGRPQPRAVLAHHLRRPTCPMSIAALRLSALLMGLAGGPHCMAMCGAACAGVIRLGGRVPGALALDVPGRAAGGLFRGRRRRRVQRCKAWAGSPRKPRRLRPVWTLFHLAVLAWGLMLVVQAHQPMWVSSAGRSIWSRVRPAASARGGVFADRRAVGLHALRAAVFGVARRVAERRAAGGCAAMALFAVGSGVSLSLAPPLLARLQQAGNRWRQDWGTRAAGALLVLAAAWGLWMDLAHRVAVWCGLA